MSSFALKILAIIFMTIDHIGFLLYPSIPAFRIIGRLAFPIFAFQASVGFCHTKNKENYILRMLIFAFVSQIPFMFFIKSAIPNSQVILNIGATLLCGLLALYCIEKYKNIWIKSILVLSIVIASVFIPMDYGWFGVCAIILFYILKNDKLYTFISLFMLIMIYCSYKASMFAFPALFSLIFIFMYNDKKGPSDKYLFYVFYPLHMLVLIWIKQTFFI